MADTKQNGTVIKILSGVIILLIGALVTEVVSSATASTYPSDKGAALEERVANMCEDIKEVKNDVKSLLKCCVNTGVANAP